MRVFVAGATGVVGRRAVARLVAAGHQVTGLSRSPEKDELLRELGASPVRASLWDRDALERAVAGHDVVVNLATHIPPVSRMARPSAWTENERIRREGSTNLVDAALAAGATVFVQESIAFLYGEHGNEWIDAASTSWPDTPFGDVMRAAEDNAARFGARGGRGVVLRFGRFYAYDSDHTVAQVRMARRGLLFDVGPAGSYAPVIDADDAATAVVAALGAPGGTYDIVDDEPMTRDEQSRTLAHALGRRRLWRAPSWAAPRLATFLMASQRVSNERFCAATQWRPASPSVRAGFPKLVRRLGTEPALPARSRLMLWILAIAAFGVGLQAEFFPRSFYDDFPFGRGWVAMDGRYNEHLIRDVGALNLALLVFTIGALFVGTRAVARIAAVSWLAYSVPHVVYHLRHLTMSMSGDDKVAIVVSLSVPVAAAIVLLATGPRARTRTVDLAEAGAVANLTPASARS